MIKTVLENEPPFPGNDIHFGKSHASMEDVVNYTKSTLEDAMRRDQEMRDMKQLRKQIQRSSRSVKLMIRHAMKDNIPSEVLKMIPGFRRLYKRK